MPHSQKSLGLYFCIGTFICFLFISIDGVGGFGAMSSIAASLGEESMFCAIEASGKQQVICWGRNSSSPAADATSDPSLAALSGGGGFICGLKANTFQAFCWSKNETGTNLVPLSNQNRRYSYIAAGQNHVCGIRSSLDEYPGMVDCWAMRKAAKESFSPPPNLFLDSIVAGNGFTCGLDQEGMSFCWGSPSPQFNITSPPRDQFDNLASGSNHVCGIMKNTAEVKCWGDDSMKQGSPPAGTRFIALAGGPRHSCGIRQDNHAVECWGSFNQSSIPKGAGFLAIAATDMVTCAVREDNLILDCWGNGLDYDPPLQLCSPGLCTIEPCSREEFLFN